MARKLLFVFELEGVLGHTHRNLRQWPAAHAHRSDARHAAELKAKYAHTPRPHLQQFLQSTMRPEKGFEIAVWSALPRMECMDITELVFGKYANDLLFVTATRSADDMPQPPTEQLLTPPVHKSIDIIRQQFPEFSEVNTLFVGPDHSLNPVLRKNELIVPRFTLAQQDHSSINDSVLIVLEKAFKFYGIRFHQGAQDVRPLILQTNLKMLSEKYHNTATGDMGLI